MFAALGLEMKGETSGVGDGVCWSNGEEFDVGVDACGVHVVEQVRHGPLDLADIPPHVLVVPVAVVLLLLHLRDQPHPRVLSQTHTSISSINLLFTLVETQTFGKTHIIEGGRTRMYYCLF